jgi:hypothetical protein
MVFCHILFEKRYPSFLFEIHNHFKVWREQT